MLISLQPEDPRPLYLQIAFQIKDQIMEGLLQPGDFLPSVRELAGLLEINMHTVHRAYRELRDQGVVQMRLGQNVRIAAPAPGGGREEDRLQLCKEMRRVIVDGHHLGFSQAELLALFRGQLAPAAKPGEEDA